MRYPNDKQLKWLSAFIFLFKVFPQFMLLLIREQLLLLESFEFTVFNK